MGLVPKEDKGPRHHGKVELVGIRRASVEKAKSLFLFSAYRS
jgi:hypothetical protein